LLEYFKRLYGDLGIPVTPNVLHFIEFKERRRAKRLQNIKTSAYKKERMNRKYLQLAEDEKIARKERSKRDGTYAKGMNMQEGGVDGYTLDDLLQAATSHPTTKRKKLVLVCHHCGQKGHSTTRSTKCLHHKSKPTPEPEADPYTQAMQDRAEDIDNHAGFELQDDTPSDHEDEFAEFYDVGTWETDDEEEEEDDGMNRVI
jgi:hypothetical protein